MAACEIFASRSDELNLDRRFNAGEGIEHFVA
jgi:hypothetical protein